MSKKLFISILLFCCTMQISSAAATNTGYITHLHSANSGNLFLKLSAASINPANCTNSLYILPYEAITFTSDPNQEDALTYKDKYKSMYNIILAAKIAGQRVQFRIHDTACIGNHPIITLVSLI